MKRKDLTVGTDYAYTSSTPKPDAISTLGASRVTRLTREPSGDTPKLTWELDGCTVTVTVRDGTYTHDGDDRSFTLTRTDKIR